MNRRDLVLAALAAGAGESHSPVQVQKLLFLIDRNVSDSIGGPFFDFRPYDYGPFDATVYDVLRGLTFDGLASTSTTQRGWKQYELTPKGQEVGAEILEQLSPRVRNYVRAVSEFVRTHSFADLVSAIYKAYPEMKVNSVFRG